MSEQQWHQPLPNGYFTTASRSHPTSKKSCQTPVRSQLTLKTSHAPSGVRSARQARSSSEATRRRAVGVPSRGRGRSPRGQGPPCFSCSSAPPRPSLGSVSPAECPTAYRRTGGVSPGSFRAVVVRSCRGTHLEGRAGHAMREMRSVAGEHWASALQDSPSCTKQQ